MGVSWSGSIEWLGATTAVATVPPWTGAALSLSGLVLALSVGMLLGRALEIKRGVVRNREATFRLLADSMPQIVWTTWPDGRTDFVNRRWFELTGLTERENRDGGWSRAVHPDDRQAAVDAWNAANALGEPFETESRLLDRAKGAYRWHLSRTAPLRDEAGRIIKWVGTATDIEDRKRAEAALRELHLETAEILDNITDAHFTLDRDWRFTDVGPTVAERLGRPREALAGRSIREVFPETIGGAFHDHFHHAMRDRVAVHFEARSLANDQWHETHVFPTAVGLSVYLRDITDRVKAREELRKAHDEMERRVRERTVELARANTILQEEIDERHLAENALRESEAVLRGFYDGVAMAMGVVEVRDHDLLCLSANPTSTRFLGLEPGVLDGCRATRLGLSSKLISVVRKHCRESERAGRPVRFEYESELPTCPRWLSFTVHTIAGAPEGRPWFSFVAEDVTERKDAEAALRDSEERYRLLFEANPHPMWVYDVETLAFLAVNEAAVRHYGYSREEFLASTIALIRPPEDVSRIVAFIRDRGNRDYSSSDVWRHLRKDGRLLDVEATSRSIMFQGRSARIVLANDVTERARAEASLRRYNRELEMLNAVAAGINRSLERPKVLATLERLLSEHPGTTGGAILESGWAAHVFSATPGETPPPGVLAEIKRRLHDRHVATREGRPPDFPATDEPPSTMELLGVEPRWRHGLCVPLAALGGWPGLLVLCAETPMVVDPDRAAFFEVLGRLVGAALRNARLLAQARFGRRRLRALSLRLVRIQETERRRLACELHDEVGQVLTGLKLSLEMAARLPAEARRARLDEAWALTDQLLGQVRRMSLDLRPSMLDDLGLLPAMNWLFEQYTARTGVRVNFEHAGLKRRFPAEIETAAYRIAQEALTNVARHAGVDEVVVRLWAGPDALGVQVQDLGGGFDPRSLAAREHSNGLSGMRERALLLAGRFTIESDPGAGTRLTAELPLSRPGFGRRVRRRRR